MQKRGENIISLRLTDKNIVFLTELGFLDRRTGRSRKNGPPLSRLINEAITDKLEKHKGLEESYIIHQRDKVCEQIRELLDQRKVFDADLENRGIDPYTGEPLKKE